MNIHIIGDPEKAKEWVYKGIDDYFDSIKDNPLDFEAIMDSLKDINPKAYNDIIKVLKPVR